MNIQKIQSHGISVYRRQFQPSQNRTDSSSAVMPISSRTDQENEFEAELERALEGFTTSQSEVRRNLR